MSTPLDAVADPAERGRLARHRSERAAEAAGRLDASLRALLDRPATAPDRARAPASERRIVFLIGAVHFINVLDFMMVMPLGPDFARQLGIPSSQLGLVGGSYTAAAAAAGIAGAFFLDRFDRRRALAV